MELHLQHLRTGETCKLSPQRTLVGSADHANIHLEDSPFLAALIVRYPSGWAMYGLCDEGGVTFNRKPLAPAQVVGPRKGDLLEIGTERFTFIAPSSDDEDSSNSPIDATATVCLLDLQFPDGQSEYRAVDHALLFGRLPICHVQVADTRLSRLHALLAARDGLWYMHNLSRKVIGRNRKAVPACALVCDGDEWLLGPLVVRVELREAGENYVPPPEQTETGTASRQASAPLSMNEVAAATDFPDATDDGSGDLPDLNSLESLRERASALEQWLKAHPPRSHDSTKGGLGAWLESQRDRLKRFWYDTPEATTARGLRTSGRYEEAFVILDRAIRMRPDSPDLLRELYRFYDALEFIEFCYRPLRQIEKLAALRGSPDPWALETLARLCERLSIDQPSMTTKAVNYWTKLEAATGNSYSREKKDVLARRALRDSGFAGSAGDTQ